VTFEPGQRVRIPHRSDLPGHVRVEMAVPVGDGWQLFVERAPSVFAKVELDAGKSACCEVLREDGAGDSCALLAGLWAASMCSGIWREVGSAGVLAAQAVRAPDERSVRGDVTATSAAAAPPAVRGTTRYRPSDRLLAFLESL